LEWDVDLFWIQDDILALVKYEVNGTFSFEVKSKKILRLINTRTGEIVVPSADDAKVIENLVGKTLEIVPDDSAGKTALNVLGGVFGSGVTCGDYNGISKTINGEGQVDFKLGCCHGGNKFNRCFVKEYKSNVYTSDSGINICFSGKQGDDPDYNDVYWIIKRTLSGVKLSPDARFMLFNSCILDLKTKTYASIYRRYPIDNMEMYSQPFYPSGFIATAPNSDWSKIALMTKNKIVILPISIAK
jgi:hypothetical protein